VRPVRERGNLLLVTLLMGNTLVNSAIAIILSDITSGWVGLAIATSLILVFGEIIPQSICSQHGLRVGAYSIWVVKIAIVLFYLVAKPLSLVLDWSGLGPEAEFRRNIHTESELAELIRIHTTNPVAVKESGLLADDGRLLGGCLRYKRRLVRDVMTGLARVKMVPADLSLGWDALSDIYRSGFTRLPVFDGPRENITGILYTKDLILVDPEKTEKVARLLQMRRRTPDAGTLGVSALYVAEDTPLSEVFKMFKRGDGNHSHMLLAGRRETLPGPGKFTVTGVITLEDVLEEILATEIVDETDSVVDANRPETRFGSFPEESNAYLARCQEAFRSPSKPRSDDHASVMVPPAVVGDGSCASTPRRAATALSSPSRRPTGASRPKSPSPETSPTGNDGMRLPRSNSGECSPRSRSGLITRSDPSGQ
jgi:metal transporter CNNM